MWKSDNWQDYCLLDTSDGERLERWGDVVLVRPDPQVIWHDEKRHPGWNRYDARYQRSKSGGGSWDVRNIPQKKLDEGWRITYRDMTFKVCPTGFKHTGVFPEQAVNWDYVRDVIEKAKKAGRNEISVLNLFAYTGGATLACAKAGAKVCHVDASRGMVGWAKENAALSGLAEAPIRYIVEDCKKFLEREIRRGHKYDGLIMDPPSYGRGPSGELWKLEDDVDDLLRLCASVLSDEALFVLVNSYTTGLSASTVGYLLDLRVAKTHGGHVSADEIGIPVKQTGGVLPAGATARWIGADALN